MGWSEHGDRPEFDLVTGISAGALIAPFAFLGRAHDRELAGLFTTYGADQIYQSNILSGLFGGNALADSAPLARLIEHYVDARFLRRVAEERAKGRFLLVGTTNLDAQRPVYWDMGKIAQKGDARALQLFRQVLLASASIPGIFPPVLIQVEAGGQLYQEMHVDGGTTREVFFTIADFRFREIDKAIGRKVQRRLWIIRNGKIEPEYKAMPETTLAIAQRSLETLTKSRGIGDLARMYSRARADNIDYNLAAIPADFDAPHPKPFDRGLYADAVRPRAGDGPRRLYLGQGAARGHRRGQAVSGWGFAGPAPTCVEDGVMMAPSSSAANRHGPGNAAARPSQGRRTRHLVCRVRAPCDRQGPGCYPRLITKAARTCMPLGRSVKASLTSLLHRRPDELRGDGAAGLTRAASFDQDFAIYRYGRNRDRAFEVLR